MRSFCYGLRTSKWFFVFLILLDANGFYMNELKKNIGKKRKVC